MSVKIRVVEEHPGAGRLGRHVEHDERSKAHAFTAAVTPTQFKSVTHRRYGEVFDQGDLGSCTGNATAGAINTKPQHVKGARMLHEVDAVSIYELATTLDNVPGAYPPVDTGSSGLAAAKAAKRMGLTYGYTHAFTLLDALAALQQRAVITGVDWYEGFDRPDANGLVKIAGQIRGGHEFEVKGFQWHTTLDASLLVAVNSWGKGWGKRGVFCFTVSTWRQLLEAEGDVTILS